MNIDPRFTDVRELIVHEVERGARCMDWTGNSILNELAKGARFALKRDPRQIDQRFTLR